jgi:imidazolonepropionase-like amidohydrolase
MKVIADIAHTQNKVCAAHTISAPSIKNAVLAGFDTIEHGILMDQECRDLMLERGTWLVPTLAPFHLFIVNADKMGIRDTALERAKEQYKHMEESMMICHEMGIPLGVGSDASTPFNPHGTNSLELVKMADAGMHPAEVLMTATKGNAKMLKWDKQIGTIEAGKFADIVAFDSNPIDDLNILQNCTFVMKGGEIFKQ